MTGKIFLDTNLLAYALDEKDRQRQQLAQNLLLRVDADRNGVISTQVLQELYVVATRKLGIDPLRAKAALQGLDFLELVTIRREMIDTAIDTAILAQTSFWDGLIIAAAASAHCDILWTEDLQHGQRIKGLRIENPFLQS